MSENVFQEMINVMHSRVKQIIGDALRDTILYGSYARGDYDAESDVDIALIVDLDRVQAAKYKGELAELMSDISLEYDMLVCISCIPLQEFERFKNSLPYYRNVETEGVRLSA